MKRQIFHYFFILTAAILMLAAHASYAQLEVKGSAKIDSLQLLADKLSGIQKVDILNALAYEWFNFNDEKANEKINEALTLSEKLSYAKGRGEALIYRGAYERNVGHQSQSYKYLIEGITIARETGSKRLEGYGLMQYANALLPLGKKDSTLLLYQQALNVLRDSLNPRELSILYKHWSKYYNLQSDFALQKEYLLRSLRIREKLKDSNLLLASYTDLALYYDQINKPDDASQYLRKAEILISALSDESTRGGRWFDFKYAKAVILAKQSHYKEALAIFNELKEYRKGNASLQKQTNQLIEIGFLLAELGNYELSLFNYYEALKIAEENNYQHERAKVLVEIGYGYYNLGQIQMAGDFATRCLNLAATYHYTAEEASADNLLGLIYHERKVYDSALLYYERALLKREQVGYIPFIALTNKNIGDLLVDQGKFKDARIYYERVLGYGKSTNNLFLISSAYQKLGNLNVNLNNPIDALKNLNKAELISNRIGARLLLLAILKEKANVYKVLNRKEDAIKTLERHDQLKDSISISTLASRLAGLQSQYELSGKKQQILLLNKDKALNQSQIIQQRTIIYVGIGGFAILIIVLVFLYRHTNTVSRLNKNIKHQSEEIQAQSEELINSNIYLAHLNEEINKQKEIIQSQADERYRKIFDGALEGIYQSTVEGKYLTMNASMAKIFGYDSPDEMILNVANIADQLYADPQDRLIIKNQINEGGRVKGVVLKVLKKNGESIWVKNNAQVVYDASGKVLYYEGTVEDITTTIENDNLVIAKNEELFKINSQLERFLYSASHDLRAPVSSILGLVNVMRYEVKEEVILNYMSKIEISALKLDKFIKDIADFAKTSYKNIKSERIDFKNLVDKIISRYATVESFQKIDIEVLIEQQFPFYCDNDILEVVIENLFRNSITFFDPGKTNPSIKIQIQTNPERTNIIISDNGIGIEDSHITNIFKMFYRGSDRSKGAGLGLFIVKESLQKIDASIATESYIGLGTSFHIQVPNGNGAGLI